MSSMFVAHYEQSRINAATGRTLERGMLWRIQWPGGAEGYSDLMPFSHLGDPDCARCVEILRRAPLEEIARVGAAFHGDILMLSSLVTFEDRVRALVPEPLVARSLFHNCIDALYRAEQRSCFAGLSVPRSHRLVSSSEVDSSDKLHKVLTETAARGFMALKIKALGGHNEKLGLLRQILSTEQSILPIRVDLNATLDPDNLRALVHEVADRARWEAFEFIEDPCPYDPALWQWLRDNGVPLAADFVCDGPCPEAVVSVVKPARNWLVSYVQSNARLCVTHSMDHALGQSVAAWWAALVAREVPERVVAPGLVLGGESPEWRCSTDGDVGFGCSRELAEVSWQAI